MLPQRPRKCSPVRNNEAVLAEKSGLAFSRRVRGRKQIADDLVLGHLRRVRIGQIQAVRPFDDSFST
jgi:hypothetical protein